MQTEASQILMLFLTEGSNMLLMTEACSLHKERLGGHSRRYFN